MLSAAALSISIVPLKINDNTFISNKTSHEEFIETINRTLTPTTRRSYTETVTEKNPVRWGSAHKPIASSDNISESSEPSSITPDNSDTNITLGKTPRDNYKLNCILENLNNEILDFSDTNIIDSSFSEQLWELIDLNYKKPFKHLNLSWSNIDIPKRFYTNEFLEDIEILKISNNQIKNFPDYIAQWDRLTNIDISGTQISHLPRYIKAEFDPEGKLKFVKIPLIKNNTQWRKMEPVKINPIKTEPIKTEPIKTEPIKTEPIKTEPIKTEPIKTEPIKTEPIKTEQVKTELVKVDDLEKKFQFKKNPPAKEKYLTFKFEGTPLADKVDKTLKKKYLTIQEINEILHGESQSIGKKLKMACKKLFR